MRPLNLLAAIAVLSPSLAWAQPGGGGSGGGPVTVAAGADVSEGNITDAPYAGSGNSTVVAALKGLYAAVATSIPSGTAIIGAIQSVTTNNANALPHLCGSHVFKHITSATDTQIVAASGSTTIYVCDYSISFNGTGNIFLEKATTGTCSTLTQIDQAWYGVANAGKVAAIPYYQGLNTGASAQLCANTSAGVTIDIAVNYDQY